MSITILELAIHRGAKQNSNGFFSASELHKVGLSMLGGCAKCSATLTAHNAAPTHSGFWTCVNACEDGDGFATVQEANDIIFNKPSEENTDDVIFENVWGITFEQWFYAAGYEKTDQFNLELYSAWKEGKDPAEYRKQ